MSLHYAKDCACILANQGEIPAGKTVWLTLTADRNAPFRFTENLVFGKRVARSASVYTARPPDGAIAFRPSAKSRIRA